MFVGCYMELQENFNRCSLNKYVSSIGFDNWMVVGWSLHGKSSHPAGGRRSPDFRQEGSAPMVDFHATCLLISIDSMDSMDLHGFP